MDNKQFIAETVVTPELYFLICKFLSAGPLQKTAQVLVDELRENKVLPKRTDFLGNEHEQSFEELERKFSNISHTHLLEICCRIGPILDQELTPSVPGLLSLLGSGRQSLLRTKETIYCHRSLLDYCTRLHGVSLPDSVVTKSVNNIQRVLIGREYGGPVRRKLLMPSDIYNKIKLLRRTVGHLSSVYCVLFDRTGKYIITGADDLLIKIWSALDGRLLATLRGASSEITDIAINLDNTMLAAGSVDRILRVWDMQTTSPIAVLTGHTGSITSVNFCPSPRTDLKYLVTTSTDGSIAFWQYTTPRGQKITFAPKPTQYHEKLRPGQAQMMCTTFSPGGIFLAAGSADHHVRVYIMLEDGPKRILESEAYSDAVDSVQWSHRGLRFISGSKDGSAHIWTFESQQWKSVKLCMTERLPTCPEPEEGKKLKVTMVAWDCSDKYVMTAANDFTIKIWNSKTAKLHCVLRGHKDELYVLESNPKDEYILLSAGHDGQIFLWDIEKGNSVAHFINDIDGQGHGSVFDAKWSPDGTMVAATDSHGHILILGLGVGPDKYKILPNELFFHTDYRPLLRDASHHVVDEQTQIMPHLMPPPFLVDADGNPHPAKYQRFVPGRENCTTEQLIPNIVVGVDGVVIEDSNNLQNVNVNANPNPNANANANANSNANVSFSQIDRLIAALAHRQNSTGGNAQNANNAHGGANHSQLDRMIEALANRQGQDQAPDSNNRPSVQRSGIGNLLSNRISESRNENLLNNGNIDNSNGYRASNSWGQSSGLQQDVPQTTPIKYVRRIYVRPMKYAQLQNFKQTIYSSGQFEMQEYKREMRRRPIMINTANTTASLQITNGRGRQRNTRGNGNGPNGGTTGRRRGEGSQQQPAYRTRAVRGQEEVNAPPPEEEDDDEDSSGSSGDTSFSNVEENLEDSSDDSDTESSDYSDWVADTPGPNLEPPKRAKRKPLSRRRTVSDDSSDETTEQATHSKGSRKNKKIIIPPPTANGEIPELYRPAEWLSEVIPRKAPYYPQMGDEIVYFRQGHHRYLEAVLAKKLFKPSHNSEPWNFRNLRDHEIVRVIGIKYEIRPPRLCCLKLAIIDEDGNMTGPTFKIKYHDMPDVLDFLVLRQTFDLAVQRNWSVSDRFRCMIGDGWWMGQIESRHPLSSDFPDSLFMCFRVRWDNGEYEYMSPWDMEPIDENRVPNEVGGAVPVLPEEIRATLYQPKSEEWHRGDRDGTCRRIINGLEQIMRLSIAEHFLAPVDLNIYPDYAYMIEYPIDLTTIKYRFENHFYRRITSAQFDVRYLATNAEKYNRSHTNIVKHARIITDLCLRIIREPNDIDVAPVYHQFVDVYHSSESENDNESDIIPSTSTGPSTSAARQNISSSTRRSNRIRSDGDWRSDCRQLLDLMWQRPDSLPFREPVDTIEFSDYLEIISTPMDLRTVKEDLLGGNYDDPLDFAKDVRLIFQNSKNYNTNKRSRIYSMTLRLGAFFESHIKSVITNWKAARRRSNKNKVNPRGSTSSPTKRTLPERNRAGPSTRKKMTRRLLSSDDEGPNETNNENSSSYGLHQRRTGARRIDLNQGGSSNVVASTSSSNRVTSSSSYRRNVGGSAPNEMPLRSSRRNIPSQRHEIESEEIENTALTYSDEDDTNSSSENEDDSSEETSDEVSDESNNDHADSNEESTRKSRRRKKIKTEDEDSEDSYNPNIRRRKGIPYRKSLKRNKQPRRYKGKRNHTDDNDDNHDDDDLVNFNEQTRVNGNSNRFRNGSKPVSVRRGPKRRCLRLSDDDNTADTVSHVDESTQDTVNNSPKKKGRPSKSSLLSASLSQDGPSTSRQAMQINISRSKRQLSGGRREITENDHSYHLPVRNGRIAESDTDSMDVGGRPTRASVKKAILEWGRGSDLEEDSEEAEEILPTPTRIKMNGTNSNLLSKSDGPSTSRAALSSIANSNGYVRQLRTNRNTIVERSADNSEDENASDNEPLAASRTTQNCSTNKHIPHLRSKTIRTPHPHPLQRHTSSHGVGISSVSVTHMTRSQATSTTLITATSSSLINKAASSSSAVLDHNYLGDTGPSTSSGGIRNTRKKMSRLQNNPGDDLDSSIDPLENNSLFTSSRLRRGLATSTSTPTPAAPNRRGRLSHFCQSNRMRKANENDQQNEEEKNENIGASDEGTVGDSRTLSEDASDSDDNQPLTSYVSTAKRTRNYKKIRQTDSGGHRFSDDSFACDDDDEDYELPRHTHFQQGVRRRYRKNKKFKNMGDMGNMTKRSGRNQKRPRYNEESDDDGAQETNNFIEKRGQESVQGTVVSVATTPNKKTEEIDENDLEGVSTDGTDEQLVSVSSRGRVRKITPKARGIFKD